MYYDIKPNNKSLEGRFPHSNLIFLQIVTIKCNIRSWGIVLFSLSEEHLLVKWQWLRSRKCIWALLLKTVRTTVSNVHRHFPVSYKGEKLVSTAKHVFNDNLDIFRQDSVFVKWLMTYVLSVSFKFHRKTPTKLDLWSPNFV